MTTLTAGDEPPARLDQWLTRTFAETEQARSRTYFQGLISSGLVTLNGETALKRALVMPGDEVTVTFTETPIASAHPENLPLDILYEDEDLIAINKAAGMVVHPAPGSPNGTLVNALLHHLKERPTDDPIRPGIVHRLDKETSGVIIVAKNEKSHEKLCEAFAKRAVHKAYLAIVLGSPPLEQTIDAPIGRDLRNRQKMAVREGGKPALSHVYRLETSGELTLVRVEIETGRTHQIRVHLASKRTPVLGDTTYGPKTSERLFGAKRQMLHAHTLSLAHPKTGQPLTFTAEPPADFNEQLKKIC